MAMSHVVHFSSRKVCCLRLRISLDHTVAVVIIVPVAAMRNEH